MNQEIETAALSWDSRCGLVSGTFLRAYLAIRALEPVAPPREVTEAMVDQALDAFWIGIDWRSPTSETAVSQRQKMHAALTAALNVPVAQAPREVTEAMAFDISHALACEVGSDCHVEDIPDGVLAKVLSAALDAPAWVEENALNEQGLDCAVRVLRQAWDQNPINDPPSLPTVREAFKAYFEVVAEGLGNLPAATERSSAHERAVGESPGLSELRDELWQDLLDKDDRTSPTEYPEMALITFEEFSAYLKQAARERGDG